VTWLITTTLLIEERWVESHDACPAEKSASLRARPVARRVDGVSADATVAHLDQVDPIPFDQLAGVRVRRPRRPFGDRMLLTGHDSLVALDEPHVRPAGVDGRDVAADGVDPLD